MREPDATFSDPRQAVLYDVFNNDRSDLEAYVTIADEVEAHRVVDVGCGTGEHALLAAGLGLEATGVDIAAAAIAAAEAKAAERGLAARFLGWSLSRRCPGQAKRRARDVGPRRRHLPRRPRGCRRPCRNDG